MYLLYAGPDPLVSEKITFVNSWSVCGSCHPDFSSGKLFNAISYIQVIAEVNDIAHCMLALQC